MKEEGGQKQEGSSGGGAGGVGGDGGVRHACWDASHTRTHDRPLFAGIAAIIQ